jgi:hypothetical protein
VKGKAKLPGPLTGPRVTRTVLRGSRSLLDVSPSDDAYARAKGARSSLLGDEESLEAMLEQSEGALREVGVKLNELSGSLLEIGDLQASIRRRMKCSL